jgi:hypothetical protein
MEPEDRKAFADLRNSNLKTATGVGSERGDDGFFDGFFEYFYERPARKHPAGGTTGLFAAF